MKQQILILFVLAIGFSAQAKTVARGKYMVRITGCNDCHTPMYGMRNGQIPESEWLIGSNVGFMGPWGTTYPANLRAGVQGMEEKVWINYMKNLKTRPPMPFYDTSSISQDDMVAMYRFIKSLGPSANLVPAYVPPGEKPQTPYIDFNVRMPQ
jgi:hypothetical protein